jgi:hypothetical protein
MTSGVRRIFFVVLAVVISATFWLAGRAVAAVPLEIDAVKSAKSLPGTLEAVGVVAKRNTSVGTFSLIDREEFRKCQSVSCANFLLPVRWSGKLPSITSVVKVKGPYGTPRKASSFSRNRWRPSAMRKVLPIVGPDRFRSTSPGTSSSRRRMPRDGATSRPCFPIACEPTSSPALPGWGPPTPYPPRSQRMHC